MSKLQVVRELHQYARKNFPRRKFSMYFIGETIQIDLIEMQPYQHVNRNHRYILIAIDVFSKMAYAEPLLNKTGVEVTKAMDCIIRRIFRHTNRSIKNIQSDDGKEFFNSSMKRLFEKYRINHYSSFSFLKSSIVERVIRTIKRKLYMDFSLNGNYKWLKSLPLLIDSYNNTW